MFGYAVIRCVAKETVLYFLINQMTTLHYTENYMELQISKGKKKQINLRMYLFLVTNS